MKEALLLGIAASLLAAGARAGQDQWTAIGPAGQSVTAFVVFQETILWRYAGTRGAGVFVTTDGQQWTQVSSGLPNAPITALAVSPLPFPPCPAVCTAPPPLLAATDGSGVFSSGDGGGHWAEANSGLASLTVIALASAPGTHVAYAATSAGLFKTIDDAATWAPVGGGLSASVSTVAIDPLHSSTVYVGTFNAPNGPVLRSADGGATWAPAAAGLPNGSVVVALAVDPRTTATIYASVSVQGFTCPPPCLIPPPAASFRVYKSVDSGASWAPADAGLTIPVLSLIVDPSNPSTLYAGGPGGVFRSLNGGATWTGFNAGLSDTNIQVLALDPLNTSTVYAGSAASGVFADTFSASGGCNAQTLCLVNGRFQVQVTWNYNGVILAGQATPVTSSAGSFWFLTPDNLELTVKILDGRSVNGKWWVFYGALSNVEYTIVVTDTVTLATRTYSNLQGQLASVADTSAF